jgi:probable HAF family extracellular repeat protein
LTQAQGINSRGQIVGLYEDGTGVHGFLYDRGEFSTIDVPGAVGTKALGINPEGHIVGEYEDINGIVHGYVLRHGAFTTIDAVPGAISTRASSINPQGQIVGTFHTDSLNGQFLWDNGVLTPTIDFPSIGGNGVIVEVSGINSRGQIVGEFVDGGGIHGFLFDNGVLTPIDAPAFAGNTLTNGINSRGQIVGSMGDHGFIAQ